METHGLEGGGLQQCSSRGMFQGLALAGGGYRGLFAARALQVLEDHIQAPIATRFDLITGTSIGGIIALAAAYEVPMSHVVSTFERYGDAIFRVARRASHWRRSLDAFRGVFSARYSASALRSAITEILPKDLTLAAAKHAVAIPAVNMTQGRPQVFKSPYHRDWARDKEYRAVDVALATSAAPTYFELAQLDGSLYADGGLFANAPDLIAIHEAERFLGFSIERIRLLGVGTTKQSYSVPFALGRNYGIREWMAGARLFNVTISAQQQFTEQIVRHRLRDNYVRIDHDPSSAQLAELGLDRADANSRRLLVALGKKIATDLLSTDLIPFLRHAPSALA